MGENHVPTGPTKNSANYQPAGADRELKKRKKLLRHAIWVTSALIICLILVLIISNADEIQYLFSGHEWNAGTYSAPETCTTSGESIVEDCQELSEQIRTKLETGPKKLNVYFKQMNVVNASFRLTDGHTITCCSKVASPPIENCISLTLKIGLFIKGYGDKNIDAELYVKDLEGNWKMLHAFEVTCNKTICEVVSFDTSVSITELYIYYNYDFTDPSTVTEEIVDVMQG